MPKKRENRKKLAPVFHIYCEGEKTEPYYLNGYIDRFFPGNRRLKVEKTKKNTPVQLVKEAVKAKNDQNCPEGDFFWVVFDREGEAKYSKELHQEAYQCAQKNNVSIALSNVCFEVWILLHFEKSTASYNSFNDLKRNSNLREKHINNYDKGDKNVFEVIADRIATARINAIEMNQITINAADPSWTMPYQWNPFSDVYKLLDAIDEFGNQDIV
jgi:RloB-like protein